MLKVDHFYTNLSLISVNRKPSTGTQHTERVHDSGDQDLIFQVQLAKRIFEEIAPRGRDDRNHTRALLASIVHCTK